MPRPKKNRRICSLPFCSLFVPAPVRCGAGLQNAVSEDPVVLKVDEFETVRLIDYEGFDQKTCAEQMNVARTTVQAMYESARSKVAECLVEGRALKIEGGDYDIEARPGYPAASETPAFSGNGKIAVPVEKDEIYSHFGRAAWFKIYIIEDYLIRSTQLVPVREHGRGTLAAAIRDLGVNVLICSRIGNGAIQALCVSGVIVCREIDGNPDDRVAEFLCGKLSGMKSAESSCGGRRR
jgi:predicted DNA-binding protein (UPF0251 family)/predicted Fe-Mo cluster-binding NifX family protein